MGIRVDDQSLIEQLTIKNELEWETLKNTNEDEKVNTNPVEIDEIKLNNSKEKNCNNLS